MKKIISFLSIFIIVSFFLFTPKVRAMAPLVQPPATEAAELEPVAKEKSQVTIHLFSSKTCPHCMSEKEFLYKLKNEFPEIRILEYEISNRSNSSLVSAVANKLEIKSGGVPVTVIGDQYIVGFGSPETTGVEILNLVSTQMEAPTDDVVSIVIQENSIIPVINEISIQVKEIDESPKSPPSPSENYINVPLFGQIDPTVMSLPALTFVIALVDGFNPCAMWALMFLISLLLGLKDRKRMWILGITFIFASGFVYFLFLTAWLNIFLFLGFVTWIRYGIGLIALAAAFVYLRDYWVNKDGACKVEGGGKKKVIFEKLKSITTKKSLVLAIIGMILLAFAVNLVELVCSAGLPAVFTQILAMNNLSTFQYYLYILFYIFIFMLDDLVVFAIAMITLKGFGLDSKYARYSHLIGGILMLIIGLAMLFKPELLTFA